MGPPNVPSIHCGCKWVEINKTQCVYPALELDPVGWNMCAGGAGR